MTNATYSTFDLWRIMRRMYYASIHRRWDAEHGWYLDFEGRPGGPYNCLLMSYHILHYLHEPSQEDARRAASITRHVIDNRDAHMGQLRSVFGDEQGGGAHYPRLMVPLAIALKHWGVLGMGAGLEERFREELYHYFQCDVGYMESNPRDNQDIASHFVCCAFAYWATGDAVFLDRAREMTRRIPYVYTEKDLRARHPTGWIPM